ncbi:MAG: hypothetical protein ABIG89_01290 [Candidatus Woesearchaeota archaeon]
MLTTIQISKETKQMIGTFGTKEDTYESIIKRMYKLAMKMQLHDFLMSSKDCLSIDEAIKLVEK